MSGRKITFLTLLLTLLFTLLMTPAAVVLKLFPLPAGLAYQDMRGSLWQGSVSQAQYQGQRLTDIKWQLQFSKLFTGAIAYQISFGQPRASEQLSGHALVSLGLMGKKVENAVFRMPAQQVKPFLPIPMGDIAGRVIANIKHYHLGQPLCQAVEGELNWNKAGVDLGGKVEFGSIEAELGCEQGKLLAVFDGDNTLGLAGQATISAPNKFAFSGFLKPDPSLPAVVHQGISFVAKMDSKGRYKITL